MTHERRPNWEERELELLLEEARSRCDWCGNVRCTCDDDLFDADELGLDPEDDDARRNER